MIKPKGNANFHSRVECIYMNKTLSGKEDFQLGDDALIETRTSREGVQPNTLYSCPHMRLACSFSLPSMINGCIVIRFDKFTFHLVDVLLRLQAEFLSSVYNK